MPIFLSQWMLYGLAAVAVPVIIHLLQHRRVVQMPFSTCLLYTSPSPRDS